MLPYTLDNNLVYGYNGGLFNHFDKTQPGTLQCSYARATRQPGTFQEECHNVARMLVDSAAEMGRTPMILLSGGYDSEVTVRAFLDQDLPFQAVTFRLEHGLNRHELFYVEKFSKRYNFEVRYVDVDIESWLKTEDAAIKYDVSRCHYAEMLPHMILMDRIWDDWQGMPVLGNGDLYVTRDINPVWRMNGTGSKYVWNYLEYEYILAWFRYAVHRNMLGGIGFFQHTPEITLSMAQEPEMYAVCMDQNPYKMSSRSTKYVIYKKYWPDLLDRLKYDGGELTKGLYYKFLYENGNTRMVSYQDVWKMPFPEFYNLLQPL